MALTFVTVTGHYQSLDGTPANGTVTFTLSASLMDTAGNIIYPAVSERVILVSGAFSLALPSTTDASTAPTGLTYQVVEAIAPGVQRSYSIVLDHTLGSTQDLAGIAPATDRTLNQYALVATLNSHIAATTSVHGITDTSKLVVSSALEIQGLIVSGAAAAKNNVIPPGAEIPAATTITTLKARVGTAPTGAALVVRFNLDGSSIGTVTINASSTSGSSTISQAATAGQILTFDITSIGSSVAGSDVWVVVVGV